MRQCVGKDRLKSAYLENDDQPIGILPQYSFPAQVPIGGGTGGPNLRVYFYNIASA